MTSSPEHWKTFAINTTKRKKEIEEEDLLPVSLRTIGMLGTVHKSQGLTFSRVVIDFTGGVFAGGQTPSP